MSYTLSECQKLKEIGFDADFYRTTPEDLLDWLRGKFDLIIHITASNYHSKNKKYMIMCKEETFMTDTLSEAVYQLALWAWENKLLEGK